MHDNATGKEERGERRLERPEHDLHLDAVKSFKVVGGWKDNTNYHE